MKTLTNYAPALRKHETLSPETTPDPDTHVASVGLVIAPVRKRLDLFPEMITVGRTGNNDIVIPDATVSKFHAYFRVTDKGLEIVDAGSRNGTKVMAGALWSESCWSKPSTSLYSQPPSDRPMTGKVELL